jgi:hypothetical protein
VHSLLLNGCDSYHGDNFHIEFLNREQLIGHLLDDDNEEDVDQEVDPVFSIETWVPQEQQSHAEQHCIQDVDTVQGCIDSSDDREISEN